MQANSESTPNVAEVLAETLRRYGVTEIFGQSLPSAFFLAAKKLGISQVSYRTENAGGAMADGFARISNRIGVIGAQNGPAATLLVPPLSEAMQASVPLLALVQEVPLSARDRNAFQELDHFSLFAGCAKWVRQLNSPDRAVEYLNLAITAATSGRPGPAVLLLPKDVLVMPARSAAGRSPLGTFPLDRCRPEASQLSQVAQLIADAERPIVIAGGGVHLSVAAAEVADLQERASLPVATTNMGKGSVSERHELSVGVVGNYMGRNSATRYMRPLIEDADLVLLLGTRTNENGTDSWTLFPDGATFVHVDVDGAEVGRNYEAIRLVSDVKLAVADLIQALESLDLAKRTQDRHRVVSQIVAGREAHRREVAHLIGSESSPIRPERVMAELNSLLTEDTIVVADASYSTIWANNYLQARRVGQRFLTPRGLAGLGWGFPMALGAKAARPEAPVICIVGDGGFAHVWAELETAVRAKLPITLVLLNNSILGFQKHSELFQFGDYTTAIDFAPVDHAGIAESCGAKAFRIEQCSELRGAFEEALSSKAVTLVEVRTDPDAYPPITLWDRDPSRVVARQDED